MHRRSRRSAPSPRELSTQSESSPGPSRPRPKFALAPVVRMHDWRRKIAARTMAQTAVRAVKQVMRHSASVWPRIARSAFVLLSRFGLVGGGDLTYQRPGVRLLAPNLLQPSTYSRQVCARAAVARAGDGGAALVIVTFGYKPQSRHSGTASPGVPPGSCPGPAAGGSPAGLPCPDVEGQSPSSQLSSDGAEQRQLSAT